MKPLKHVAIIMDGNGRWGVRNGKSRNYGHKKGIQTVEKNKIFNIVCFFHRKLEKATKRNKISF